MPSPPDRPVHPLEIINPSFPLSPLNVSVQSGLEKGVIDIRWSNPSEIPSNTKFSIIGVNVYRSFDSEFGPWFRMNTLPVGANFWRDKTTIQVALEEDVSCRFTARGCLDPSNKWIFKTVNRPVYLDSHNHYDCTNLNVRVTVDGDLAVVDKIYADLGEIELNTNSFFDPISQTKIPAVIPNDSSVVLATYRYLSNNVPTDLIRRVFYRVCTVTVDSETGFLVETPLDRAKSYNNRGTETLDWIWREAVRRNQFLLDQAGERVKLFIRRSVGHRCGCSSSTHDQPDSSCITCYGTGIIGGYDGPYSITIAPDDAEQAITQTNRGRTVTHNYETWTGPTPMLSQRDFIVKLNGDRYAIGAVRFPTSRGMILQQHFPISHLDEQDIRSRVPVFDTNTLIYPNTRYQVLGDGKSTPMITERSAIPDEREFRGNTVVFENNHRR